MIDKLKNLSGQTKIFIGISALVLVLDQITKYWAVMRLTDAFHTANGSPLSVGEKFSRFLFSKHPNREGMVTVVEDFWHFRYVENPGAAWGFLADSADWFRTPFFVIVSILAMGFILVYFHKSEPGQRILRVALALVFGGAVGNFIDRIRLSYVIDFIDWHYYREFTWPTFNVADMGISIGVGLLIVDMFVYKPEGESADAKGGGSASKAKSKA